MTVTRASDDIGRGDEVSGELVHAAVGIAIPTQRGHAPAAVPDTVPSALTQDAPSAAVTRRWFDGRAGVLAHVVTTVVCGAAAGWLAGLAPLGVVLTVAAVVAGRLPGVLDRPRPDMPRPSALVNHAAMSLALVALASTVGAVPTDSFVPAGITAAAALLGDLAATAVRRRLRPATRILVVGEVDSLALALTRWSDRPDVDLVGALEVVQEPETGLPDLQVSLGLPDGEPPLVRIEGLRDVPQWASAWRADTVVVIPGTGVSAESLRTLGWHLERTATSLAVTGLFDPVAPHRISTRRLGTTTLLVARPSRPPMHERLMKAGFDRALGAVLLVLLAPVIAALCVAVRMDSTGPGLFRQIRVGRQGRDFEMVKLRTMYVDAEARRHELVADNEGNGVLFKIHDDPRITRLGHFLRRSSLDELPQLINVVRGEMSLVGPRPALPSEVQEYEDHMHRRYVVRPGMTGLWQVSGRSDLSGDESVDLDLHYVDNHVIAGDLAIMVRTVGAVLGSKGAY